MYESAWLLLRNLAMKDGCAKEPAIALLEYPKANPPRPATAMTRKFVALVCGTICWPSTTIGRSSFRLENILPVSVCAGLAGTGGLALEGARPLLYFTLTLSAAADLSRRYSRLAVLATNPLYQNTGAICHVDLIPIGHRPNFQVPDHKYADPCSSEETGHSETLDDPGSIFVRAYQHCLDLNHKRTKQTNRHSIIQPSLALGGFEPDRQAPG